MKSLFSKKRKNENTSNRLQTTLNQLDNAHTIQGVWEERQNQLSQQIAEMTNDMNAIKSTLPLLKKDLKTIDRNTNDAKKQTGKISAIVGDLSKRVEQETLKNHEPSLEPPTPVPTAPNEPPSYSALRGDLREMASKGVTMTQEGPILGNPPPRVQEGVDHEIVSFPLLANMRDQDLQNGKITDGQQHPIHDNFLSPEGYSKALTQTPMRPIGQMSRREGARARTLVENELARGQNARIPNPPAPLEPRVGRPEPPRAPALTDKQFQQELEAITPFHQGITITKWLTRILATVAHGNGDTLRDRLLKNRIIKLLRESKAPRSDEVADAITTSFLGVNPSWENVLTYLAKSFPQSITTKNQQIEDAIRKFTWPTSKPLLEFAPVFQEAGINWEQVIGETPNGLEYLAKIRRKLPSALIYQLTEAHLMTWDELFSYLQSLSNVEETDKQIVNAEQNRSTFSFPATRSSNRSTNYPGKYRSTNQRQRRQPKNQNQATAHLRQWLGTPVPQPSPRQGTIINRPQSLPPIHTLSPRNTSIDFSLEDALSLPHDDPYD